VYMSIPTMHYRAPDLGPDEVTPERVRDELVSCFMSAMSCLPPQPGGRPRSASELEDQVKGFVQYAFVRAGADYDRPTKTAILAAMTQCREGARNLHMPAAVLEGHWNQMMRLVSQLA